MAIKPTDIVIHLKNEQYLADTMDWDGRLTKEYRYPTYWENFERYAKSLVDDKHKKNWKTFVYMEQAIIRSELAKYGIEYKEAKSGPYLKFKSEADITFFKLRWA